MHRHPTIAACDTHFLLKVRQNPTLAFLTEKLPKPVCEQFHQTDLEISKQFQRKALHHNCKQAERY